MDKIVKLRYYYGRINREDAQLILTQLHTPRTGLYLLRDHTKSEGNFIISLVFNSSVIHYPCERTESNCYRIPKGQEFPSPKDVIDHHSRYQSGCATLMSYPCEHTLEEAPLILFGLTYFAFQLEVDGLQVGRPVSQSQSLLKRILGCGEDNATKQLRRQAFYGLHSKQPWFHGRLNREGAINRFHTTSAGVGNIDGLFLLRVNEKGAWALSLSFEHSVRHYQLCQSGSGKRVRFFIDGSPRPTKFRSLIELVDYYHLTRSDLLCRLQVPLVRPDFAGFDPIRYGYYRMAAQQFHHYDTLAAPGSTQGRINNLESEVPGDGRDQYDQVNEDEEERPRTTNPNPNPNPNIYPEDIYDHVVDDPTDSENEEPTSNLPVRLRNNLVAASQSLTAPPPQPPPPPPPLPSAAAANPGLDFRNGARGQALERGRSPATSLIDFDQSPVVPVRIPTTSTGQLRTQSPSPSQPSSSTSLSVLATGVLVSSLSVQRSPRQQPDPRRKATPPVGPAAVIGNSSRGSGGDPLVTPDSRLLSPSSNIICSNFSSMPRRHQSFRPPPVLVPPPPSLLPPCPLPEPSIASSHNSAVASDNDTHTIPPSRLIGFRRPSVPLNNGTRPLESLLTRSEAPSNNNSMSSAIGTSQPTESAGYITMLPTELETIAVDALRVGSGLDSGQFGQVLRGTYEYRAPELASQQLEVALKLFRESDDEDNASAKTLKLEEMVGEAQLLARLSHPHIVHFFGVCWGRVTWNSENCDATVVADPHSILLVMELAPLKSLLSFLQQFNCSSFYEGNFEELPTSKKLTLYMLQVSDAMRYLHSKDIIHRDLADRNILLFSQNVCKLSDFGLSRRVGSNHVYESSARNPEMNRGQFHWPMRWYSPEIIGDYMFTPQCDVWSFGVSCWETYTLGETPWGDEDFLNLVLPRIEQHGERLPQPTLCPDSVYALMLDCMYYKYPNDTSGRPTFEQIYQRLTDIYAVLPE